MTTTEQRRTAVRTPRARSLLALGGFLAISAAVAGFGALISVDPIAGWYAATPKPMWTPPDQVFGPVWTALYAAMSIAAWLVWRRPESTERTVALKLYVTQLAVNAIWTPAFFGLGALVGAPGPWVALAIIVLLDIVLLATLFRFWELSRAASVLLVPYFGWALFATTLNAAIAVLAI